MPDSVMSAQEKPKVWEAIERHLGSMFKPYTRQHDWRITKNKKISIYVTFSKYYRQSDCFWYGLKPEHLTQLQKGYKHAFLVFVMGNHSDLLIIPLEQIAPYIDRANLTLDQTYGYFKLHLAKSTSGRYLFRELPHFDASNFYNNYALLNDY
jgi:hypothetical protein